MLVHKIRNASLLSSPEGIHVVARSGTYDVRGRSFQGDRTYVHELLAGGITQAFIDDLSPDIRGNVLQFLAVLRKIGCLSSEHHRDGWLQNVAASQQPRDPSIAFFDTGDVGRALLEMIEQRRGGVIVGRTVESRINGENAEEREARLAIQEWLCALYQGSPLPSRAIRVYDLSADGPALRCTLDLENSDKPFPAADQLQLVHPGSENQVPLISVVFEHPYFPSVTRAALGVDYRTVARDLLVQSLGRLYLERLARGTALFRRQLATPAWTKVPSTAALSAWQVNKSLISLIYGLAEAKVATTGLAGRICRRDEVDLLDLAPKHRDISLLQAYVRTAYRFLIARTETTEDGMTGYAIGDLTVRSLLPAKALRDVLLMYVRAQWHEPAPSIGPDILDDFHRFDTLCHARASLHRIEKRLVSRHGPMAVHVGRGKLLGRTFWVGALSPGPDFTTDLGDKLSRAGKPTQE